VVRSLSIRWDREAIDGFQAAIEHIREDSEKSAEKVRQDILLKINSLSTQPAKYPLDKLKIDNDGTFRALEIHHYRISYSVSDMEIIIARIRHTKMDPLPY